MGDGKGKVAKEATALATQLGVTVDTTIQDIFKNAGGRTRNEVPKSVMGNTLTELVELAIEDGDADAKKVKKILSQMERLQNKRHPG